MATDGLRRIAILLGGAVAAIAPIADSAAATGIEEIKVTARKREVAMQEAALSVTVLPAAILEGAGVREPFDLAELVPSLGIAQSTGPLSTSYFIRRIGNLGTIPNFESAVGLFIDGAFRSRAGAMLGDLFDLQQIEVVKGPQTTFHGKNTTAGLLNIATNPPQAEFELHGKLSAGLIDAPDAADVLRLEGVLNAPLSPGTSFRAGGVAYKHDDTLFNAFNGDHSEDANRYTLRAQLRHTAKAGNQVRLMVNRFRVDSARRGDFVLFEGDAIRAINNGFGVPCPASDIDARYFCRNAASVFDLTATDVSLNLRYDLGDMELSSISAVEDYDTSRDFDADQLNIDVVRIVDRQRGAGFSQELRLRGPAANGPEWLVGAFYYNGNFNRGSADHPTAILGRDAPYLEIVPGIPLGESGDSGYFESNSDNRHFSVFGNIDWLTGSAFSVSTGLRWQTEDKRTNVVNIADHARPTVISLQLLPAFADASLSRSTTGVSWDATARYRWTGKTMGYFTAAKGFKSGGFNAGFGATPAELREFGDETVTSLELGLKSTVADDRLRLGIALFRSRYEDFQSAGWVSLRFLVNNAERVTVSGVEADMAAALSESFGATASLSYVNARFDRYTNGGCYFDRPPDNDNGTGCDLSGETLPLAPRSRAHVGVVYSQALKTGSLHGRIDWSWSGDYNTNSTLDPRHVQPSCALVNARIGLRFNGWDVTAWVRNATDRLVVMREGPSNLFPRDPAYGRAFAAPRSYGLTVSVGL